jgi:hypothetical protein
MAIRQQLLEHSGQCVSCCRYFLGDTLAAAGTFWMCHMLVQDPKPVSDPDPLVRGTDPRIRLCTEMSRIYNTDSKHSSIRIWRFLSSKAKKFLDYLPVYPSIAPFLLVEHGVNPLFVDRRHCYHLFSLLIHSVNIVLYCIIVTVESVCRNCT